MKISIKNAKTIKQVVRDIPDMLPIEEYRTYARVVRDQSLRADEDQQVLELEGMAIDSDLDTDAIVYWAERYEYLDALRLSGRMRN